MLTASAICRSRIITLIPSTTAATSRALSTSAVGRAVGSIAAPPLIADNDDITHAKKVTDCYSYYEDMSDFVGISDYTDGIYNGKRDTVYEEAQVNQTNYLLDQAEIGPGARLLDVGCGRGRLLQAAKDRGAEVMGITISPEQKEYCRRKGLDVRLQDYRALEHKQEWHGQFDAVIANGSMEHFVSTKDGLARRAGDIYENTFGIYHKLINPSAESRRVVTTVIHHRPRNGKRMNLSLSDKIMFGLLAEAYGGWYPLDGQLEKSADGKFRSIEKVDGTEDYLWTSIDAFAVMRQKRSDNPVGYMRNLAATGIRAPLFAANPWMSTWQFRGSDSNPPPTVLYRHTWEYQDA
ncbi:Cyclopropane-fatty-acyl-phospholipid synthase [Seminavis robusta]|uniref:Cyclopropane-fatty-acyl-phospholipid synthase n=1 Tax=Seminavis robusta TaxID=568900 RepID=A0A9N8EE07_9STRA|nr:Cyclopropane-fatty-acyl-phospholipid synthase [Seminavis robusta]|eukprot:Sro858_g211770.1 Cyclopropane-fatty-acyl-phospholipid synthase (350) ;mRNA; f:2600-3649